MNIIEAIILGLIQGLTEFIPVSSSGHLVIAHHVLGITETGLGFDVALNIGTLLALGLYFYKDIWMLINGILGRNEHKKLAWLIAGATIPVVIAGMLLQDMAETSFRSVTLVAANLIGVALIMLAAERYAKKHYKHPSELTEITPKQAALVGLAQAAALVPGVSRSGATITAGIFAGIDRVTATRFSFLLAIPAIGGAVVKVMIDGAAGELMKSPAIFIVGIVTAFLSGLVAIKFLLGYLAKHDLSVFAYYRIALGAVLLVWVALV